MSYREIKKEDNHFFFLKEKASDPGSIGEMYGILKKIFPDLFIERIELQKGHGNSRVYKLTLEDKKKCVLKVYPDRYIDQRPRLEREFMACKIMEEGEFPTMRAIAKNEDLNLAVYSWIDGGVIKVPDDDFIYESLEFVKRLKLYHQTSKRLQSFPLASEACLTGLEITRQIRERLNKLLHIENEELHTFLIQGFLQHFEQLSKRAENILEDSFNIPIPISSQTPSPSDFGSHNAIKDELGRITFIDFEYFGLDDPAKLASDFFWHPAMHLSRELKITWIQNIKKVFEDDPCFERRLIAYLPLFGLRWCLILLNEFLPERLAQRIHADHTKTSDVQFLQTKQLKKSQTLFNQITDLDLLFYGSTL